MRWTWERFADPRRRGYAAGFLLAMLVLVLSALPLRGNEISRMEEAIFSAINSWPDWLGLILFPVMQLGTLVAVAIAAAIALFVLKRSRVAIDLALAGIITWAVARIVKAVVERGRPGELISDAILRGPEAGGYGYISGHTAVAAALATVVAAYSGRRGKVVAVVLAGLVGVGRMFVGAHLPLDVVGGAAAGWAVGALVHFLVLPEIERREHPPEPSDRPPPVTS